MNMASIGAALRRQRTVVIAVFLLLAAATAATVWFTQDRYTSTTTLYVQPSSTATTTSTVSDVTFLMPALEALVAAAPTRAQVEASLPGTAADAQWDVDGTADPGTGLLRVAVTSTDPDVAPLVADAYTPVLEDYVRTTTTPVSVTVIEPAGTALSDRAVRITSIGVAGLLLATIAATAMGLAADRRRR